MRRPTILLARAIGYIDAYELLPKAGVYFPDLVTAIGERYKFQKSPKTLEEHDLKKGVEFLEGKAGRKLIQKFVIWDSLMVVETLTSTADSKAILADILEWGSQQFGLLYGPETIRRHGYISDISFYSDAPLLSFRDAVTNLAAHLTSALSEITGEAVPYYPLNFRLGHDPLTRKYGIAPFLIERRGETSFSENKYFSEAPLPTDLHLKLVEQFELDVLAGNRERR